MTSLRNLLLILFFLVGLSNTSIPKCLLMKAEMYHLQHASSSLNKPTETSLADSNELYDPDCDSSGLFRAKQCNNTDMCWCVDSAGVRLTDMGDRSLKCEELVEKNWVQVKLKPLESSQFQSAIASAVQEQYEMDQKWIRKIKVKYDLDARLITLDLTNNNSDLLQDLSGLTDYTEKDFEAEKLEMESILVYYEEEDKIPTVGILTVTAVVILIALVGLLILFLVRRQKQGKYEKAQTSEIEDI